MNILVISNTDSVWLLPAWGKFKGKLSLDSSLSFLLVPDKLGKLNSLDSKKWAFRVFGYRQALLLSFFSLLKILKNRRFSREIKSEAIKINGINEESILRVISDRNIDIVVITCSYYIPGSLLKKSGIPWINKHSSLLPNCRGLFPYIWGSLHSFDLGVTYHLVNETFDSGEILFQKSIPKCQSMVEFYKHVYAGFPDDLLNVLERLASGVVSGPIQHSQPDCYFSIPSRMELKSFYKAGYKVLKFRDFLREARPIADI